VGKTCVYPRTWLVSPSLRHTAGEKVLNPQQFGQDYGVWLKEWRRLSRAVFVIDRHDRIVYTQYVADQRDEPEYAAALEAVEQVAWE